MKNNLVLTLSLFAALLITVPTFAQKANKLSKAEKKAGWTLLFNGKNFDGWRQCNGTAMPANWVLEDQAMKVLLGAGKKPGRGARGDILFSDKQFKNFELSIDWKASKSANSGIFYYVREISGKPIYYEKDGSITIENEYKDGKIYRNGILIGEEYEYEHKEKGMLDVIKMYETDGSNKVKLIMAYPQDDEMILFILDENHNITDSINPDKNPEKLMMIAQKIGFNFME